MMPPVIHTPTHDEVNTHDMRTPAARVEKAHVQEARLLQPHTALCHVT